MIAWLFNFQDCCEQFDNPTGGLKLASVGPFTPQELANVAEKKMDCLLFLVPKFTVMLTLPHSCVMLA